jgi:hypothetical protein
MLGYPASSGLGVCSPFQPPKFIRKYGEIHTSIEMMQMQNVSESVASSARSKNVFSPTRLPYLGVLGYPPQD